ncbi:MAG: thiamine pyrophosphate-dependent enzyme [Phycisphaerae bacterium]
MFNRAEIVDRNFIRLLEEWDTPLSGVACDTSLTAPVRPDCSMTGTDLLELFDSQMTSRHLDLIARELRKTRQSFYTIGSSGHEGNAAIGRLTRHTDPAFLHYRSGAFMLERARKLPGQNMVRDTILGLVVSAEDPTAGGRHKVWGSKSLWVPPQTSTVGSHLPKAVGTAIAIGRAGRLGLPLPVPKNSIVICSLGDAGTQHAAAGTAINAACYASYSKLPVPILLVSEDNGIGISVRTEPGWVRQNFEHRANLRYFAADGLDIVSAYRTTQIAVEHCRRRRAPVFLHLKVVRLLGHAGSDPEMEYRRLTDIEATEALDPLLTTARIVIDAGLLEARQVLERYEDIRRRVRQEADVCITRPKLSTSAQIMAPLAPYHPELVHDDAAGMIPRQQRIDVFGGRDRLPENTAPQNLGNQINNALFDLMAKYDRIVLFGEDVAQRGGVYYVTKGLHKRFGPARVFNTLLDETTILGLAQGFGLIGMLPIAEIQYLAYYHNAEDQLRGEACSMQFFSQGQFRNPMVVRIASFGYQEGFGGHFHNDNSISALRDIPGLIIAAPSRGDDAAQMLRTAVSLAAVDGRVVAFLEPIALYKTRDLHEKRDGGWLTAYPPPERSIPLGQPRVYHPEVSDLAIITYANGLYLSLRAARRLLQQHGIKARVVDLRWLNPLNEAAIAEHGKACGRVLVVDEGRRTAGVAEAIVTALVEWCSPIPPVARVTGLDTYIPLGPAARYVLPTEDDIIQGSLCLCGA